VLAACVQYAPLLGCVQFKKGLVESGLEIGEEHFQALFRFFDSNCSGYISFDEFSTGVRPAMNNRRRKLVLQAFSVMDKNGDGALTVDDVASRYDCRLHPDVVAGTHTELEVLNNFLAVFDGSLGPKSAIVTPEKFIAYYSNLSASIDNDDYFELVLRNVWHISGGEGQFENTSCRRLLVTHDDGTQTVEEIGNDFDVTREDLKVPIPTVSATL
jgi:calcyphosin